MLMLISPQQWLAYDQWFNFQLPAICLILGGLFLFVGLIPLLYARNKVTWSIFYSLLGLCIVTGIFCGIKSSGTQVKQYFAQTQYITPQTRTYSMQLFFKKENDPYEIAQYRYVTDINNVSHLTNIYQKKAVKQRVEFLGRDDYYIYVKLDKMVMKFSTVDCEKISGNQAYFSGYRFIMRNKDFEKIGFLKLPYNMRDKILVPKDQWNKKVPPYYTENYAHPGLVANWIPDSEK